MIKRKILKELLAHLTSPEISLLTGPRQAGKTTLMFELKDHLGKQGQRTLFLSLDFESDQPYFHSQPALISKINLEFGQQFGYVFIDEIQRKENAGLFLKGLYDLGLNCKLIVSNSGSLELKEKIHESLAGRKRVFEISPLTFEEFCDFRTEYRYSGHLDDFFNLEKENGKALLTEYLNFGGYPRVVLEKSLEEKRKVIDELYRSVLERDIAYLLKVEKVQAFSQLIKVLASQVGMPVNYSELSSTLAIALPTVQNYLWYAQKTFMLEIVRPFFKNPRSEITKSPVIYFLDLGLRNYSLGLWGIDPRASQEGFLFQNFVYLLLREKIKAQGGQIYFWRTKDKAEVDFIVETQGKLIAVEVKFTVLKNPQPGRPLRNFIQRYQPDEAWIVNLGLQKDIELDKTQVKIFPFYTPLFL